MTAIDTDEEEFSTEEEEKEELAADEDKLYTPFSCATDNSFDDDKEIETFIESPTKEIPETMRRDNAGQFDADNALNVEDYYPSSPIPTVRSVSITSDQLSEVQSAKETDGEITDDCSSSDVENRKDAGKLGNDNGEKIRDSDDNSWVEDVELFEDSDIEYAYRPEKVEENMNEDNNASVSIKDEDFNNTMEESSVKDYIEMEEGDVVEHVHIEADKHDRDSSDIMMNGHHDENEVYDTNINGHHDINEDSDQNINLDLHLAESEFTEVIEIEQEEDELTPRAEKYGTNQNLGNDIHVVDYIDETPRSEISDDNYHAPEYDQSIPKKRTMETSSDDSVESKRYAIKAGEKLHVYDFDERSSSCEDIESEDKQDDQIEHSENILKSGMKPKLSDIDSSVHEECDRPSSLTVIKGSPEDVDISESDYVYNRYIRTEYERQNGQAFDSKTDADALIDKISEGFEQFVQFHHDHTFEVVEVRISNKL